jgi:hypothetical protein
LHVGRAGYVTRDRGSMSTTGSDSVGRLVNLVPGARHDDHACPSRGLRLRDGAADAPAGTGDERYFTRK